MQVDDWGKRLEESVREWAAQIILALEHLHTQGIVCRSVTLTVCVWGGGGAQNSIVYILSCRDLNPANVLLTDSGEI